MLKTLATIFGYSLMALALSLTSGCTAKYLRLSEPPPQNPGLILPIEVWIEVKAEHADKLDMKTRSGKKVSTTKKLSGELVEWDNGVLTIQADRKHRIRTDYIKRMEIGSSGTENMGYGCLTGIGASAAIWVLIILLI
jgi:hypothetical protein